MKPVLLPFALVGARRRSWWLVAIGVGIVTLIGAWQDYIAVARNASDVSYVWLQVPMMLVPLIAWLGRCVPAVSEQRREALEVGRVPVA